MKVDTPSMKGEAPSARAPEPTVRRLRLFVFGLFFVFGGITSLNDAIIPKLKELFTLNYGEVLLIQSAFFAAYFLISPGTWRILSRRSGCTRGGPGRRRRRRSN